MGSQGLHVFGHVLSRPSELDLAMLHVACSVSPLQLFQPVRHLATQQLMVVEEKKREKTITPFGVDLMRSQVFIPDCPGMVVERFYLQ